MQARFLLVLWPQARSAPSDITKVPHTVMAEGAGYCFLTSAEDNASSPILASHQHWQLLHGEVFTQTTQRMGSTPEQYCTQQQDLLGNALLLASNDAAWLAQCGQFWGDFFAFQFNKQTGSFRCYLSPMARQEWFYLRHQGAIWISNDIAALALLSFRREPDWDYLYYSFFANGQPSTKTGLMGVRRILGGQSLCAVDGLHVDGLQTEASLLHQSHWDLFPQYRPQPRYDIQQASVEFAAQTQAVIAARIAQHERVVVQLSGGFDSAILLACVRDLKAADQVLAVNYYDAGDASDERPFAQAMADHVGVKLTTMPLSSVSEAGGQVLARLATVAWALEPSGQSFGMRASGRIQTLADEFKATAILTGNGGDQVFGQFDHHVPAVDFAQDHGLVRGWRRGLWSQALASAHLNRQSVWWVAKALMRHRRAPLGPAHHPGLAAQHLFPVTALKTSIDAISMASWQRQFTSYPKVKQAQLQALYLALTQYRHSQHNFSTDVIHPLLSEPLVNYALTLPSYLACHDGVSRGLARLAFQEAIPASIHRRLWKGATISFFYKALVQERAQLRDYLLSGFLARHSFFNTEALNQTLQRIHQLSPDELRWILRLLDTEAWAQRWFT